MRLETLKRRVGWKGGQTRVRVEKLSVKAPLRPPGHLDMGGRAQTGREEGAWDSAEQSGGFTHGARLYSAPMAQWCYSLHGRSGCSITSPGYLIVLSTGFWPRPRAVYLSSAWSRCSSRMD